MIRRLFQLVVLFFAAYAFVFVPLGQKTAFEHVKAIVRTPAARQAGSELKGGVERLVTRLRDEAEQATRDADRNARGATQESIGDLPMHTESHGSEPGGETETVPSHAADPAAAAEPEAN